MVARGTVALGVVVPGVVVLLLVVLWVFVPRVVVPGVVVFRVVVLSLYWLISCIFRALLLLNFYGVIYFFRSSPGSPLVFQTMYEGDQIKIYI